MLVLLMHYVCACSIFVQDNDVCSKLSVLLEFPGGGDNIHVFTIKRRLNKLECRGKVNLVQ